MLMPGLTYLQGRSEPQRVQKAPPPHLVASKPDKVAEQGAGALKRGFYSRADWACPGGTSRGAGDRINPRCANHCAPGVYELHRFVQRLDRLHQHPDIPYLANIRMVLGNFSKYFVLYSYGT